MTATATATKPTVLHTVFLHVDKLPRTPGGAINGPVIYKAFKDLSAKGKANPEIDSVLLRPGPNHNVTDEQIAVLHRSEVGQAHLTQGVITVKSPTQEGEISGTSLDYSDADAIAIIAESADEDWLSNSYVRENRTAVRNRIKARQEELERQLTKKNKD